MRTVERYVRASEEMKIFFWLCVVDVIGLFATLPLMLLSEPGYFFGWLLGSAVEAICYLTMIKGSGLILDFGKERGNRNKGIALSAAFSIGRLLLIVGSLILSAFLTFKIEGNAINFFTTAGAYLPLLVVAIVFTLIHNREKKAKPEGASPKPEELEVGEEEIDA